jgi:hypothetical protein
LEAYTGELELLYWTLVQYTVESAWRIATKPHAGAMCRNDAGRYNPQLGFQDRKFASIRACSKFLSNGSLPVIDTTIVR